MKLGHAVRTRAPAQSGFSLVELMVAMILGVLLVTGVVQIFISSKQTFRTRDQLATLTDNGRFAVELLQREIRMAGYSGCRTLSSLTPNVVANSPPPFRDMEDAVQGFDNGAGWTNPTAVTRVAGTDVITVTRASERGVPLTADMALRTSPVQVSSQTTVITDSQLLMVSDCEAADLFRVSTVTESSGTYTVNHTTATNTTNLLSKAYQSNSNALAMTINSTTYFIGVNGTGGSSLYSVPFGSATPTELVSGVQDMQIQYAVDTDNDRQPDDYVAGAAVTDWTDVLGVNVGFLLQTDDGITADPQNYTFNGANANPTNDKRLRTAFWSAIALRNRMQ